MKKLIICFFMLVISLVGLVYAGFNRSDIEAFYTLPQAKSYVYSENRRMCFEVYSNKSNSNIKYTNKNQYALVFDDITYTLNNVSIEEVKQDNMYLYIIESDMLNPASELFSGDNAQLKIINSNWIIVLNIGYISILKPSTYTLLSVNDIYGSYSYVNGSLELVGINISFPNTYSTLNSIIIGDYASGDLSLVLENQKLGNEIKIIEILPTYNILSNNHESSLVLSSKSYFIPITYPKLVTITQGFILFSIDSKLYYLDTFNFIVNKLWFSDYEKKMVKVEIEYDKN